MDRLIDQDLFVCIFQPYYFSDILILVTLSSGKLIFLLRECKKPPLPHNGKGGRLRGDNQVYMVVGGAHQTIGRRTTQELPLLRAGHFSLRSPGTWPFVTTRRLFSLLPSCGRLNAYFSKSCKQVEARADDITPRIFRIQYIYLAAQHSANLGPFELHEPGRWK